MSSLNDFKDIADEIMKDIVVSDELKQETLRRISNKKEGLSKILIVPAACVIALIIAISLLNITLRTHSSNKLSNNNVQNANTLKTPINSAESSKSTISGSLNSLEDAKKFLGYSKLVFSYLPKNSKLIGIQGISFNNENRKSVYVQYALGNGTFVISIEQDNEWKSFEDYKDVDVNGRIGHIKTYKDGAYESAELRWFEGKTLFSIEGEIVGDDALKTARSIVCSVNK